LQITILEETGIFITRKVINLNIFSSKMSFVLRLTINGGSNGGLLVAASSNQRPDLFGCALPHLGSVIKKHF